MTYLATLLLSIQLASPVGAGQSPSYQDRWHPSLAPLSGCAQRVCNLEPSLTGLDPLSLLGMPSRDLVKAVTSRIKVDPTVMEAAMWLAESRVQLDVKHDQLFVSLRMGQ